MARKDGSICKASPEEIAKYKGCYPLYGFAMVDGVWCAVEDLRGTWQKPDPLFEIMSPDGQYFFGDCVHAMLCHNLADVKDRASWEQIAPCDAHCGC
jgi:hypothetical protein